MKHKLNKSPEEVLGLIKESVTYASKFTEDVEWSCEDGTRTDLDFMCKSVELAINCGAKTINIPDTVGYSVPSEFKKIIETLINKVPNIDKAILSWTTQDTDVIFFFIPGSKGHSRSKPMLCVCLLYTSPSPRD